MVDNLLPNTNWQLFTQLGPQECAMNHQGTGTQANISISSFDPSNNNPNFYTPNTEQIEVGALVYVNLGIPAFGNGLTALRVNRVVPNSLFQCKLPFGIKSPTESFGATALPVSVVDYAGQFEAGPDGWKKSASMVLWPDDFSTNACLGAKRVLGLRKQSSGAETFFLAVPERRHQEIRRTHNCVWGPCEAEGAIGTWYLAACSVR